ncbi:cytochrome P450 [Myxococcota bacterium]|nr:cytochrome P450 [Myxococcota bacterium]
MKNDVDLSDPETYVAGVPHRHFHELRENDPVHWQPECPLPGVPAGPGYWALTRYEDVSFVSKNPKIFSSERGTSILSEMKPKDRDNMRQQLINMDPPAHTELRNLMSGHFKPRVVRSAEQHTRQLVVETLDALLDLEECDFVEGVSAPISLRALTDFLGVPSKDSKKFYKWTNKLIGSSDPGVSSVFRARIAVLEIFIYAASLARRRRKRPTGDIYSSLVNGSLDGVRLDRLRLNMNFFLLLIAGNETTRNALSGGVQALCENPDQFELLRRERSLIHQAIEEMLRFSTPVMQFRRTATCDTRIGDKRIRKGDKVVMYYGAANRDPEVFENPDRFDITRNVPHLAFGTGTHFCAGSHMARLEMRVTLEELMNRFPGLHMKGPVTRLRSNFINGIKEMPVGLSGVS